MRTAGFGETTHYVTLQGVMKEWICAPYKSSKGQNSMADEAAAHGPAFCNWCFRILYFGVNSRNVSRILYHGKKTVH